MSGDAKSDHIVNYEKLPSPGRPVQDAPVAPGRVALEPARGGVGARRLLESRADFDASVVELLALARRELRIFDPDLAEYGFNTAAAEQRLQDFLAASRDSRLMIAVHDTAYITQFCPRLMRLLRQFSHAIAIHQTHDAIRNVDDVLIVADDAHYLRRPHHEQPKGVVVLHDPAETRGWLNRFEEIWEQSSPAVSATTIGL